MTTTATSRESRIRIESIQVVGRFRRDLGEVEQLSKSIADVGLINAITLTPNLRLIAGQRRIEACRLLGWETIPARIVDNLDDAAARLRAERDENTCRKEMAVSELMDLAAALEELERPKAAARKAAHGGTAPGRRSNTADQMDGSAQSTYVDTKAETREVVAKAVGMSVGTYNRARAVHRLATDPEAPAEDREAAQKALKDMDAGTPVTTAYQTVRQQQEANGTLTTRRTSIDSATAQRRAINAANTTLSGICHGLKQIEDLHPAITSEEAAQWRDGLSESRAVIERLIKRLKERSNAQA